MVFEVQGKTDNYVKLSKDTEPGIEFLSSRKLIEYEIQMEALGNNRHMNCTDYIEVSFMCNGNSLDSTYQSIFSLFVRIPIIE